MQNRTTSNSIGVLCSILSWWDRKSLILEWREASNVHRIVTVLKSLKRCSLTGEWHVSYSWILLEARNSVATLSCRDRIPFAFPTRSCAYSHLARRCVALYILVGLRSVLRLMNVSSPLRFLRWVSWSGRDAGMRKICFFAY